MVKHDESNQTKYPNEWIVPCVRELMLHVDTITLDAAPSEVLALLQTVNDLPALPIVDSDNNYIGIVVRHNYLSLMTDNRSHEFFSHDSIRPASHHSLASLFNSYPDIFTAPLITHDSDYIDQVMVNFLARDAEFSFATLPVLGAQGVLGVVKVADMVNKLVEVQAKLIDTMQQSSGRLQEEVANAASLQNNLLRPAKIDLPSVHGLATLITSSEIGGDFYDYYVVDERWVVMLVGDVSGHGVAAGTMVSAAKAGVNLLETDREKEPAKILERLNHSFIHTAHQSLLMTMVVVCLDTQTNELRYANAGHQFPYIYRAVTGCLEMLELGGSPLGANETVNYKQQTTEMEIGDRLFIYTDGIVEEENDQGDCFGYERLEEILVRYAESDLTVVRDRLLEALSAHVDRYNFSDDVTLFYVEYYERQRKSFSSAQSLTVESYLQDFELIRVIDSFYRNNQQAIPPHIARQNIAFLAEANFSDIVPSLAAQGIRRILVRHHTINRQLGWNNMLKQHQYRHTNDLAMYLPQPRQQWQFQINHSDDKDFILEEVDAWLQGMELPDPVRVDAVVLLLDELIENGLYAAPRDGKNIPLYSKGTERKLLDHEMLELTLVIQNDILGISVTDNWGTLTPSVFLNRLSRDVRGPVLDSGVGGGGLYFIWRMSDYLQLRVFPHHQTQICAFLDLKTTFEPETDKSFQFFYHTEIHEESDYEQLNTTTVS